MFGILGFVDLSSACFSWVTNIVSSRFACAITQGSAPLKKSDA